MSCALFGRIASRFAGGGVAAVVNSFSRVRHLIFPRNANSETAGRTLQIVSILFQSNSSCSSRPAVKKTDAECKRGYRGNEVAPSEA